MTSKRPGPDARAKIRTGCEMSYLRASLMLAALGRYKRRRGPDSFLSVCQAVPADTA